VKKIKYKIQKYTQNRNNTIKAQIIIKSRYGLPNTYRRWLYIRFYFDSTAMGFLAADLFDRGRHICMGLPVS